MISRITDVNTAPGALHDLGCIQSRFADVQGLLLRRDVNSIAMYHLYAGREFGEYLWEVLVEVARELRGGPSRHPRPTVPKGYGLNAEDAELYGACKNKVD